MDRSEHRRPWHRVVGALLYGFFLVLILVASVGFGWSSRSPIMANLLKNKVADSLGIAALHSKPAFENVKSLNVLVLGCDADYNYGGTKIVKRQARSDMMLLAKLDFEYNRIEGISIPRDTLCEVPGYRNQKINAYHAIGGKDLAKKAVETILPGVKIDRVVVLDFAAFEHMVQIVGGVDIYVPKLLKYTDKAGGLYINIKPGRQHLDGYNSMCFVRFRHSDDDFQRSQRQRDFMIALKDSVKRNISKLPEVSNAAVNVLGGEFNTDEITSVVEFAQKVGSDNIKMGNLPVLDAKTKYDLVVDDDKLDDVLKQFHFIEGSTGEPKKAEPDSQTDPVDSHE